ncbi:MAG: LLM class F420-dependent oxidoreductase [Candidatus Binatia bacterium]|nr:MAG: LLM class F420-dependent oxidoreductase [Candidatus Binatia bacterium]
MRFGITTPVVTLVPRTHASWEETAGPEQLRTIARRADELGYHHLSCSEHVAIPVDVAGVRGGRYYDPGTTLAFFAAITEKIRLLTHVLVLPYHHPLEVAKRYGTLDVLSGGRLILGVGVGSLAEEFSLLGVDFAGRGPRYEDALRALKAVWGRRLPEYHGTHFRFSGFIVDPAAPRKDVPIWVGGRSPRSLRRALRFGDGWDPFGLGADALETLLRRARDWPEWAERAAPFDLALSPERPLDLRHAKGIEEAIATVERYRRIGATVLNLRFRHATLSEFLEQLETFASKIAPRFSGAP